MLKKILSLVLLFVFTQVVAQEEVGNYVKLPKTFRYRIYFNDKDNNPYSIEHPEQYLSSKSLARREKYNIKVDEYDLPITPRYLDYLNQRSYQVVNVSKWNNTAIVEVPDTAFMEKLAHVDFIKGFVKVWESPDSLLVTPQDDRLDYMENMRDTLSCFYGQATDQLQMLNLPQLHDAGFQGKDIHVAVIDGGFYNTDGIAGLRNCNIAGTRNFVQPQKSVFEEKQQHGTMVLSCMAAQHPFSLVGTAPEATYYLLVSEDNDSEQLIEEDYWCSALEYADSIGVDIVTSSLGYYRFDDPNMNHKYHELDGKTAINSRSASLAASRGIVLINSAGNEGDDTWKKIGFPADARNILAVGAVDKEGLNTIFSSIGNTADGRIKPDVMAMGQDTWVLDSLGNTTMVDGTSFSAPILCGAVVCLMQAHPERSPFDIIDAIRKSGNNTSHPNNIFGYGVPDIWKAHQILNKN